MPTRNSKSKPTWTDVKAKLANLDRPQLLALVQDLYAANKDNQTFLHARFGLVENIPEPYQQTIHRWLWPDISRNQYTSVAKAKQAIVSYNKAVGEPAGTAELMVFFCERAVGFINDVGFQDEPYFAALIRMFKQALIVTRTLPDNGQAELLTRLDEVRRISHDFGYGVGRDLDFLFAKYAAPDD